MAKPMSDAQKTVLSYLADGMGFPGYCELMMDTGCKSYKAVDWVLDALERRGYITYQAGEPTVTEAGRQAAQA